MNERLFRILLVEDNSGDVYLFERGLIEVGLKFELIVIEDGAEAMVFIRGEGKYAGRAIPDLAVLDLNLPKRAGAEVLEAIRRSPDLADIPVVVTSSSASPNDRIKTEQMGVERYIQKPLDLDDFLKVGLVFKNILMAK